VAYAQYLLDETDAAGQAEAAQAVHALLQSLGEAEAAWHATQGSARPVQFFVIPGLYRGPTAAATASLIVLPPKSPLYSLPRTVLRDALADQVAITVRLSYLPPGQSRTVPVWAGSTAALVLHGLLDEAGLLPDRSRQDPASFALARLLAPLCAVLDSQDVRIVIGRRRMQRLLRAAKRRLASTPDGRAIFDLLAPYGVRSGPLWQRGLRALQNQLRKKQP
jgi:hypothetical protein